ncbi:acid phosphatase class B [Pandoravirus inopinatum]|uniref:Acid phosphatase class B n=1 Tax=Pandoravirus inopinatum TaxID=1605721 RepID=A0A0B5IZP9_9VIRU|nr:acid phosphatase class B [Pandoravirus inopinatum]AJF98413.1 acid phosphatase class B [Pandoravirus inopinatum]
MPVHANPAGRTANPVRARRTSFGPVAVTTVGQTTERTLAMLGTRRRRDSLNSLASPSWSALGRPQPPPGSPAWTAGLAPASPSWGLATPMPHHGTSSLLLQQQQQHDPAAFKAAVDAYMTSPTYDRFVESLCAEAMRAVEEFLRTVPAGVPVVYVFDVDDTLLSSHPGRRHRFAAHLLSMGARMPSAFLPPLDPVVRFYQWLRARGVRTVILTGRRSTNEAVTLDNLRWVGVDGYDHAIFRTKGTVEEHMDAVDFKKAQRKRLVDAGYVMLGTIGDQHSDILGGNSGIAVKLPNPMHTIP